jgi:peptidoglycan/xylan/chitin deacetylase (PgdA/CDA1 family)
MSQNTTSVLDRSGKTLSVFLPSEIPDQRQVIYTIKNILRPVDLAIQCENTSPSPEHVFLTSPQSADGRRIPIEIARLRQAFETISGRFEDEIPKNSLNSIDEAHLGRDFKRPEWSEWGLRLAGQLPPPTTEMEKKPKLTVHLTHDVDRVNPYDPMGLIRRLLVPTRGVADGVYARLRDFAQWMANAGSFHDCIEKIMAAEARVGARATYFMMSGPYSFRKTGARTGDCRKSRRFARIVRMAQAHGHRIGLHGCAYSLERRDYARQSEAIAQVTGQPVTWHRNHYLVWDAQTSPGRLRQGGVQVDSTVGFNTMQSFRAGLAWPYELWDFTQDAPAGVMEIPMVFMDAAGVIIKGDETWEALYRQIEITAQVGGEVAVNFHPDYFLGHPQVLENYQAFLEWLAQRGAERQSHEPRCNTHSI